MAKKVVATIQRGRDRNMVKAVKMVKSKKTGAYEFKESMVHTDNLKNYFIKE